MKKEFILKYMKGGSASDMNIAESDSTNKAGRYLVYYYDNGNDRIWTVQYNIDGNNDTTGDPLKIKLQSKAASFGLVIGHGIKNPPEKYNGKNPKVGMIVMTTPKW